MSTRQSFPAARWLALLASLPLFLGCAPQAAESGQGLVIQNPVGERDYFIDFGSVPTGQIVTHVFELKNTDSVPITIQDMTPSCSCTAPFISYTTAGGEQIRGKRRGRPVLTIPAGVTAQLEVEIDTNHVPRKNVDKLAMVVLRCDSLNKPYMSFEMHLLPTQAYQVTPKIMDLGEIPISSGSRSKVDLVTALPDGKQRVLGVASQTEGLEVTIDEEQLAAESMWHVHAVLSPPLALGPWQGEIALRTTDDAGEDEGEPFLIQVQGHVVPDVVMFPPALGFTKLGEDQPVRVQGVLSALAAGHRVRIVDSLIQGDVPEGLKLEYAPQAPDSSGRSGRWDVMLTVVSDEPVEGFAGRVQFTLEDPSADVIEVQFIYRP